MKGSPTRGKAVDVAKAIELYEQGLSMCAIGKQLGHAHSVIAYHLYKNRVPIRQDKLLHLRQDRLLHPEITTEHITELYEQGMGTTEIGERVGLTAQSIYGRLLKAGVTQRSFSEAVKLAHQRGRFPHQKGEANPNWKGGRAKGKDGYIEVRINGKQFKEHRVVWEQAYGTIPKGAVIHHLNGLRDDNRLENLAALTRKRHSPTEIIKPHQVRIRQLEAELRSLRDALQGELLPK